MKAAKILLFSLSACLFVACSNAPKEPLIVQDDSLEQNIKTLQANIAKMHAHLDELNKKYSEKKAKEEYLKKSAYLAKEKVKESLETNLRSPDSPPLYLNPTFAKMVIFPYVSDGIYHSQEEVWIQIKDGRFILNQVDLKKKKVK